MYYAELFQATGREPIIKPYFQLGRTEWLIMPGTPMIYMQFSTLSGFQIFNVLRIGIIWAAVEISGVYILSWHIFRRVDMALIAAGIIGSVPTYVFMMGGGGYPNIAGLALIPFVFDSWLQYWDYPTKRSLIKFCLIICGAASLHHVTTLWLGITFSIFCVVATLSQPLMSTRKLLPILALLVSIGFPVMAKALNIFYEGGAVHILTSSTRFWPTRITWDTWFWLTGSTAIFLILPGTIAFLRYRGISGTAKLLVLAYFFTSLVLAFGWLLDINFDYARALYFLGLPMALGGTALIANCSNKILRYVLTLSIIFGSAFPTMLLSPRVTMTNNILTPEVINATEWVKAHSQPTDVIVTGTLLGFHLSRLVERPTLVSMSPELIGISSELPYAESAMSIMRGSPQMREIIQENNVKYIIVRASGFDVPMPNRSRAIFDAASYLRLVYSNANVLIYEVTPS